MIQKEKRGDGMLAGEAGDVTGAMSCRDLNVTLRSLPISKHSPHVSPCIACGGAYTQCHGGTWELLWEKDALKMVFEKNKTITNSLQKAA